MITPTEEWEIKTHILLQLISREFYEFYKTKRKNVAREIDQYKLFVKAVSGILITMREMMDESEGGLYIEGLGYFCHTKSKNKIKSKGSSFFLRLKKKYYYKLTYFPEDFWDNWYLKFSNSVKSREKRSSYLLHFKIIESYYNATKFAKRLHRKGIIITHSL